MYCAESDEVTSPRIKNPAMNAINYGAMGMAAEDARTRLIELKIANALESRRGEDNSGGATLTSSGGMKKEFDRFVVN